MLKIIRLFQFVGCFLIKRCLAELQANTYRRQSRLTMYAEQFRSLKKYGGATDSTVLSHSERKQSASVIF